MKKIFIASYTLGLTVLFMSRAEGKMEYSYADCTYVKGDYASTYYGSRCFCYTSAGIKWKDFWSTFQVQVTSKDNVLVVYPMETNQRNCHDAENVLTLTACLIEHYWPYSLQKEQSVDIPLAEEDVYFMTKSPKASTEYTLHVSKQRFNRMRFFLFISGLVLFFFAGTICRSTLFFYISGVSLGMLSILVFLLLVLKSFVPQRGIFLVLFGMGSGLSYLGIQKLINEWDEIMTLYWRELLGYLLISGFVSFVFCYKLGPVTNKCTLNLMTWMLQAAAMVLACHGVTYAPVSWKLLAVLLGFKILPLAFTIFLGIGRQTIWLLSSLRGVFQWRSRSNIRLLTEEEYRRQAERHTKASLEELRKYCNNPGFPAWDTVLRLRSPQRFAEFLRSGDHVSVSELQSYERHHGFGGEYSSLDSTHMTATSDDFSDDEPNTYMHRAPTSSPFSVPLSLPPIPSLPALCTPPALPSPSADAGTVCPYPPSPYTPLQSPYTEEDDEPF